MVSFAQTLARKDDRPTEDQIIVLRGLTWADFERLLAARGDRSLPRMAYLEGAIELMNPSRYHESLKSRIGCLVEAYCSFTGIEFETVGSWTLKREEEERAVEPDECYIFGVQDQDRPHLAIEVVWTSGGLDKLEVYRKLDVAEVWYWRLGRITIHVLRDEAYLQVDRSEVLPEIDLDLLASFLDRPRASQAIREYRAALEAVRPAPR